MSTPTVIRHHITPTEMGIVITVLGNPFTATFQLYDILEDGRTLYKSSGGAWDHEQGAVKQFNNWKDRNNGQ